MYLDVEIVALFMLLHNFKFNNFSEYCVRCQFLVQSWRSVNFSNQNFPIRALANWIFKRTCPFGRNPFLHNLLIILSLFFIHNLYLSVITLFFFSTYSETFASKNSSWSFSINPISKILSNGPYRANQHQLLSVHIVQTNTSSSRHVLLLNHCSNHGTFFHLCFKSRHSTFCSSG